MPYIVYCFVYSSNEQQRTRGRGWHFLVLGGARHDRLCNLDATVRVGRIYRWKNKFMQRSVWRIATRIVLYVHCLWHLMTFRSLRRRNGTTTICTRLPTFVNAVGRIYSCLYTSYYGSWTAREAGLFNVKIDFSYSSFSFFSFLFSLFISSSSIHRGFFRSAKPNIIKSFVRANSQPVYIEPKTGY